MILTKSAFAREINVFPAGSRNTSPRASSPIPR